MATSKTLAPTNQTISIPELSDAPDMSVAADAIGKEADAINALSEQIATDMGSYTASTLEDFIKQVCASFVALNITNTTCLARATWSNNDYYIFNLLKQGTARVVLNFSCATKIGSALYNISTQNLTLNDINGQIGKYSFPNSSSWTTLSYNVTYTAPSDGYVRLRNTSSNTASEVNINGYAALSAPINTTVMTFVRKGMTVKKNTDDAGTATFIPLT